MGTRRLNHIFQPDGRTFIVAFDHGMIDGPAKGMEQPSVTLRKITAGGADAILTSYGTALHFSEEIEPLGLILRMDGGGTSLGEMGPGSQFYSIEDALRLGVDAVAVSAFPGAKNEEDSLRTLAKVIGEAHKWGIPVMGEMVPGGFDSPDHMRSAESIAIASRLGAELGSDWVKIPYAEGFEKVTSSCYVPAVILGGAKKGSERTMLEKIRTALDVGAKGVAIGRNIFQADDPEAMTAAVAALIHKDISVDAAMKILKGS
jgi:DhnA family fructose-bisphosphate aldolase class Ia